MALYRIFTEDKNRDKVEEIVAKRFNGFTIIETVGYWKGEREDSLIIEVITDDSIADSRALVFEVAEDIKRINEQQAVLVQRIECDKWLI